MHYSVRQNANLFKKMLSNYLNAHFKQHFFIELVLKGCTWYLLIWLAQSENSFLFSYAFICITIRLDFKNMSQSFVFITFYTYRFNF